jgi:D-xylose reductase
MATIEESCLNEPVVNEIAAKHSATPAQVVLRWAIQRGTAVIPKTTSLERLQENFGALKLNLSPEEMTSMSKLDKNHRYNDPGVFCQLAFDTFYPIYE